MTRRGESEIGDLIPFNRPCFQGNELDYIAKAIASGQISGDGSYTRACERFLEEHLGTRRALLTPSCTHALEMAALLLDIGEGDEVILPSFTFVSTANAFVIRGAKPVFVDIRPDTLNMDEALIEDAIGPKTKAIVPVHYAGVGCEMDTILEIAGRNGIAVVEDNAHGLFGRYQGKELGTFGTMSTLSFHETKNVTCGEGGALLINDDALLERAEIIRAKGTNRSQFLRGEVDKYSWVDIGSSYLASDVIAAFLYAQLEAYETIQGHRKRIWEFYFENLQEWAGEHGVGLPQLPVHCGQSYHMFYLILPTLAQRQFVIGGLKDRGIKAVFHYVPLHTSQMGLSRGGRAGDCPVTEDISDRLVRLPFFNDISQDELQRVVDAITTLPIRP